MSRSPSRYLPALLLIAMTPALAEPIINIESGLIGDDNVNNGLANADKKSDLQEYVNVVVGQVMSVGADSSVLLTGNIEGHYFNRYEGLNHVAPGVTLAYKTKLGLGPAPWLNFSGSVAHVDYRNDVRSGWLYHGDIGIEKQLAWQWYITTALRFEKSEADHTTRYEPDISGAVFDQIGRSISCSVNYWYDNTTGLALGYAWRNGDVAASVEEADDLEYKVSAIADDSVFGPEFYAYKLHANTQLLNFSIHREISRQGMINLKFQRRISHGDNDLNYYNSIASVSYQHHF